MRHTFPGIVFGFLALVAAGPALAASELYTVKDVPVDASAAASVDAQAIAINGGQPKAWTILFHRLTREEDWPRQPQLDAAGVQRLIGNFTVTDERRSTTRYVAKVTYFFSEPAVARLLRANDIPYIGGRAKQRILVIPLSPNFGPNAPWTLAWNDPRYANAIVPVVVPSNDAALDGVAFDTASFADLASLAARYRASDVVLAQLVPPSSGQLVVKLRRLGPGDPLPPSVSVPVAQGQLAAALPAAAAAADGAITDMWKDSAAIDFGQSANITVEAQFGSIGDWVDIQNKLSGLNTIVGMDTIAFASNGARLGIAYVGGLDQLRQSLATAGITMASRNGVWWLTRAEPQPGN